MDSKIHDGQELGAPTTKQEANLRNFALLIEALPEVEIDSVIAEFKGSNGDEWSFELTDVQSNTLEVDPERNMMLWTKSEDSDDFELSAIEVVDGIEQVMRAFKEEFEDNHSSRDMIGVKVVLDFEASKIKAIKLVEEEEQVDFEIDLAGVSKPVNVSRVPGVNTVEEAYLFNQHAICNGVRKAGGTHASASYSGYGDEGSPVEIEADLLDSQRQVHLCELSPVYNTTPGGTTTYDISLKELTIEDALAKVFEEMVEEHHSGYDQNNGAGGHIEFNIKDGTFSYSAYYNETNHVEDEPMSFEVPEFVEPSQAGLVPESKPSSTMRP